MLGFTIDSINLFVSWEQLTNFDFNNFTELINAKKITNGKYKEWSEGNYKNFYIKFNEDFGIYIMGSISVFFAGNISLLEYNQLEKAIEKLGYDLSLELHLARLYRVDLALNIITDFPVNHYTYTLFTDLPRFKRLEQDEGVLFKTTETAFSIYNKKQQLIDKKKIEISENLLRLEFRILKNVSKKLLIKKMKIRDLYNPATYKLLVSKYLMYYREIKKQTVLVDLDEMKNITPTSFTNILKRNSIENTFKGEYAAYKFIEQADKEGKFKTANDKSRCKKIIDNFSKDKSISKLHPLVEEINIKVESACDEILKKLNLI